MAKYFLRFMVMTMVIFLWHGDSLQAQIVNVESKRVSMDSTGWGGNIGGSFDLTKNVTSVVEAEAFANIEWKRPKDLYLLLWDYSFLSGASKKYVNKLFLHFRYDHSFTPVTNLEAFVQYQNNEITKIKTRMLWGSGMRFHLNPDSKIVQIYLGVSLMYEYEEEALEPVRYLRNFRNSSYFSLTWHKNDLLTLVSTTFFQPRIDKPSVYRLLNQESFLLALTHRLSLTLSWDFLFDTNPVEGVPNLNYELKTGLAFKFTPN